MNRLHIALFTFTSFAALITAAGCTDKPPPDSSAPATTTPATRAATTESVATTSSPTTASSPTTTEPTTTTTTTTPPVATPPTIAPDDWEAIVEALDRRLVALYAAPDVSRVTEYCAPGTECATSVETQIADAVAKGLHVEGQQPFDVVEIEQALPGEPTPAGRLVSIVFVIAPQSPPPARLVDANGNVVDELSLTTTKTRGAFTIVSWESDPALPWRVILAEDYGPVP